MPLVLKNLKYRLLPFLAHILFRLIMLTVRVRVINEGGAVLLPNEPHSRGRMFAMWHQHLLMGSFFIRHSGLTAIISQSRDGEYLTRLMTSWGYSFIRGSSSKGGPEAYAACVELLKQSGKLWIAPDGPRGPYHVIKWGVIRMALASGSVILPAGYGYSRKITLKSWDKFQVPLPFSRAVVILGAPFGPLLTADDEEVKRLAGELETKLNDVTDRAEAMALGTLG